MTEPPQNRRDANESASGADTVPTGVSVFVRLWAYGGPFQPLSTLTLDREFELAELLRDAVRDNKSAVPEHAPEFLSAEFDNVADAVTSAKALQHRFLKYRRKAEPKQIIPTVLICGTQDAKACGLRDQSGAAVLRDTLVRENAGQIIVSAGIYGSIKDDSSLQFNSKPVREAATGGIPGPLYELLWTDESTYGHLRQAILTRQTVGRYQIQQELGRGAMAAVYKAHDQVIGRTVALKLISLDLNTPDRQEVMERLQREAQAAGKLDHPNIITVYDVGQDADVVYLSMQFLQGQTLQRYLADTGVPSLPTLISWADQISSAVGYAHAHGVIHRDLKPANLMLTDQGVIKVLDFGIAKIENATLTRTGLVIGTPSYMSPEQVAGKKVDHRTDIFALGSVFYELVTREKPFRGDVATILYKIVNEDPPAPSIINPALPGGIDAIIRKALAKNPNDRFQSCEEMRGAFLEQAGASSSSSQSSPSAVAPSQPPENRSVEAILAELTEEPTQSRRIWPGLAAAVAMIVAAAVAIAIYAPSTFTHFPAVIGNLVARAKHDVPSLVSTAVKSHASLAEQGHSASGDESSPEPQEKTEQHAVANLNTETPASSKPASVLAGETSAAPSSASAQPAPTNDQSAKESAHPSPANTESQPGEGTQEAGESDRTKSAQSAPPQDGGKADLQTASESPTTDPNAAKLAVASAAEQTPAVTPTSLTKPHPKPRREPSSVDGFTRRDIPELLREAAAAAGRGDYRLAIYSYNLILKLDPANSTAKAGLHRLQAAQQPQ